MSEYPLELVLWRDAWATILEDSGREEEDYINETVGWVEGFTYGGAFLKVVGEHTPDESRAISYIPVELIKERWTLRRVDRNGEGSDGAEAHV